MARRTERADVASLGVAGHGRLLAVEGVVVAGRTTDEDGNRYNAVRKA